MFSLIFLSFIFTASNQVHGQSSPLKNIPSGAIVEGSSRFGGLQPDYIFDADAKELSDLRKFAHSVRREKAFSIPKKVNTLVQRVRKTFAPHDEYDDPVYLNILAEHRDNNSAVPLSEYILCGAGVCRETALLLHLLLKEAGIHNFYVYGKIQYSKSRKSVVEDHAFNVFEYRGERWIADAYSSRFNGFSFDEFLKNKGEAIVPARHLYFGKFRGEKRGVIELNEYPRIYQPEKCSKELTGVKR